MKDSAEIYHADNVFRFPEMIDFFKNQGAVALILVGSVAKGTQRVDSDLDGMVILTLNI